MENVVALARIGLADRALDEVLQQITEVADKALQGAESTSITLIRGGRPFTAAHVGSLALDADELQYEQGHGPCMDAGRSGAVLVIEDMDSDPRWPGYAASVAKRGVRSSISTPLSLPRGHDRSAECLRDRTGRVQLRRRRGRGGGGVLHRPATESCATSPGRWSTGRLTPDQRRAGSGDVPAWSSRHYA